MAEIILKRRGPVRLRPSRESLIPRRLRPSNRLLILGPGFSQSEHPARALGLPAL